MVALIARKVVDGIAISPLTVKYWLCRVPHAAVGASIEKLSAAPPINKYTMALYPWTGGGFAGMVMLGIGLTVVLDKLLTKLDVTWNSGRAEYS